MYVCIYIYIYICLHTYIYASHIHICMYACMYVCVHIYIYICTHIAPLTTNKQYQVTTEEHRRQYETTTTTQRGVVYRGFCLNAGTVEVSEIASRRWWCIEFIGTLTFTGWSFIGHTLSTLIPTQICLKQFHTNEASIICNNQTFRQTHSNEAPNNKGKSPHE